MPTRRVFGLGNQLKEAIRLQCAVSGGPITIKRYLDGLIGTRLASGSRKRLMLVMNELRTALNWWIEMKRFSLVACLLPAISAFAFEATVGGRTLNFPVPDGWRRASGAEQAGLAAGLAMVKSDECIAFPAVVKPSAKGFGACQGVLAIVYNKEMTPLAGTQEILDLYGDLVKAGIKANGGDEPVFDNQYVTVYLKHDKYLSGNGWQGIWMHVKNSYKNDLFKNAPRNVYTFIGGIIIDGHVYQVQASLNNPDADGVVAFKKLTEQWFEQVQKDNKGMSVARKETAKSVALNSWKYDQSVVGDIVATRKSKFSKDDIHAYFKDPWVDVRTLGVEKAAGIDVKISYPNELRKKPGLQAHTVFAFDKVYSSIGIYVNMNIAVQAMDGNAKKLFSVFGEMKLSEEEYAGMVKDFLPEGTQFLGGGITLVAGQRAFWATSLTVTERMGAKAAYINRTYWIPAVGANKVVLMNYGVINTNSTLPPVAEFQDFIPVGKLFINSLTVNDHAQFKFEPDLKVSGSGTGWYVSSNHVITCWHVVKGCSDITFHTAEGTDVKLTLVDRDEFNDLALLKVRDRHYFCENPLSVAVEAPSIAETVFTVGYPIPDLMGQDVKYTTGAISSLSGMLGDKTVMQISTPVQPGNSGGALVDEAGNVVGVVQSRLVEGAVAEDAPQNVNYAVKAEYVRELAKKNGIQLVPPILSSKKKSPKDNCRRAIDSTVFILAR